MDKKDILKKVDHTLLGQTATWDDIRGILDDIKTSTGFSTAGATFADVELMKKYIGKDVKVKAAGGISSFDDAEKFISLGAERLDRKSTRLNSSHPTTSRMPSSA